MRYEESEEVFRHYMAECFMPYQRGYDMSVGTMRTAWTIFILELYASRNPTEYALEPISGAVAISDWAETHVKSLGLQTHYRNIVGYRLTRQYAEKVLALYRAAALTNVPRDMAYIPTEYRTA